VNYCATRGSFLLLFYPQPLVIKDITPRQTVGLVGTGIPTAVIAERYKAGESIQALADDYERPPYDIEEAIRCELKIQAA
jgi:uncharacterized protein (DUF433 family)